MNAQRAIGRIVALAVLPLIFAVCAQADFRIEKNMKLNPGGRFVLDSDSGSVTVTGISGSGAQVVVTSNRDDLESLMDFQFEDEPGEARVTARKKYHWPHEHGVSLHYEIRVPKSTTLEMKTGGGGIKVYTIQGDANLRTSGGSVEVSDLTGRLEVQTSGGGISLREVTGNASIGTSGGSIEGESLDGSLDGHTSGGPIRLDRVTGNVQVDTSGGSIHVEGAGGRVQAHTSGGSVEVGFDRGNAKGGDLDTSGGSIHVTLDPTVNLTVDASASGGGVRSDVPITVVGRISNSSLRGSLGSGGELLRLHTSGGSIDIAAR